MTSKPIIFMVNISKRDYLRSLPSLISVSGRENIRVREVIDAMFAYESTGVRAATEETVRAFTPGGGAASTHGGAMSATTASSSFKRNPELEEYKSHSTVASPTLPPISMSIGNSNYSTTIDFNTLGQNSTLSGTSPTRQPSVEYADDNDDNNSYDSFSLPHDNEPVQKAIIAVAKNPKAVADNQTANNQEAAANMQIRLSTVMCCCIKFENELTSYDKHHNPHAHAHHAHSNPSNPIFAFPVRSEYEDYVQTNPSHKSIVPSLLDELFKTLGGRYCVAQAFCLA
jgi:hypothetical protein